MPSENGGYTWTSDDLTYWVWEQLEAMTDAEVEALHSNAIAFGQNAVAFGHTARENRLEAIGWFIWGWLATRDERGNR